MGLWRKIIFGHCNITALYIFPAIKNKYIIKETKKHIIKQFPTTNPWLNEFNTNEKFVQEFV